MNRSDCWCANHKPCTYHEGFEDGVESAGMEIERLRKAGRTVFQFALVRPADGYERVVAQAAHVLYPTTDNSVPSETAVWL